MSKCAILAFLQTLSIELSLPPEILPALVAEESSFRLNALSHKNAKGLMQITPIAVKEVHNQLWRLPEICTISGDHYSPKVNLTLGACFFKLMYMDFSDDLSRAIMAYNAGISRVNDWVKTGRTLPKETLNYRKKVISSLGKQEITCKKPES